MDNLTPADRRKTMQSVKSSKTQLENLICRELWKSGIRFRRNVGSLLGKPDIALKKRKIVIFIDSCFWHGCPIHWRLPNSNREYWERKTLRNKDRDIAVTEYYLSRGWTVCRIWEHEIKSDLDKVISRLLAVFRPAE